MAVQHGMVATLGRHIAEKKGACGEFRRWRDGHCIDAREAQPKPWSGQILSKQRKP